jgi:phosphotransferase system enzyme I (PtsI)
MNPTVSYLYDPFHPAVLELIRNTISAAHEAGIWCGMCGEFAADRNATELLAQMELDEFSVAAGSVSVVKKQLSKTENVIASV